jgi:acyl-lipid omega-6 desaturase (Delta-12 desaturase)
MTASFTVSKVQQSPPLDPSLRLRHVLRTLPPEVFEKNALKAWSSLVVNVLLVGLGYATLAVSPLYLLPLAWIFTGTALTGFFVLGHDSGHRSFAKRKWVNDIVGHLMFLPLAYPFHGWRHLHNFHHKNTNKLEVDNAWDPWKTEAYEDAPGWLQFVYRWMRGPFWWLASIAHWALIHFNWNKFQGKQREQVKFSALFVIVGMAIIFPTLIATVGIWGWVKFWLMPWMVYHFWMSTFTIVHHTLPEIPFRPASEWSEVESQLKGTVHCDYPAWVEFLCHDINVHIPHHISTAIPSYNLRLAHASLKKNWGEHLIETRFDWRLMQRITDRCHLYNAADNYQSIPTFKAQQG